jgi:hypothetical protein
MTLFIVENIKKNTNYLLDASNEVGLGINAEKTKCMFMSRHQNAVPVASIKSFETEAEFKQAPFGKNKNYIHEEIKTIYH